MSDKRYLVPDGMVNAAHSAATTGRLRGNLMLIETRAILEAAIRWLAENPIVPTSEQALNLYEEANGIPSGNGMAKSIAMRWSGMMFLAPVPEVPDAVKDLLWDLTNSGWQVTGDKHNLEIFEAYRRGKAGK